MVCQESVYTVYVLLTSNSFSLWKVKVPEACLIPANFFIHIRQNILFLDQKRFGVFWICKEETMQWHYILVIRTEGLLYDFEKNIICFCLSFSRVSSACGLYGSTAVLQFRIHGGAVVAIPWQWAPCRYLTLGERVVDLLGLKKSPSQICVPSPSAKSFIDMIFTRFKAIRTGCVT